MINIIFYIVGFIILLFAYQKNYFVWGLFYSLVLFVKEMIVWPPSADTGVFVILFSIIINYIITIISFKLADCSDNKIWYIIKFYVLFYLFSFVAKFIMLLVYY